MTSNYMLLTALTFFLILSILVFIHELGHFLVARFVGVAVEEFGFGLPPRIFGKKFGKTVYSLNWLLIGGFVRLAGEDEDAPRNPKLESRNSKNLFWARSKKERACILLAGVAMNFFLAVGLTAFLLHLGINEPSGRVRVDQVQPNGPAEQAGIQVKDVIVSAGLSIATVMPVELKTTKSLIDFAKNHGGTRVTLSVLRDGKEMTVILVPRKDPPPGQGPMGVVISDLEERKYSWTEAPVKAMTINVTRARDMLASLGTLVFRLVTFQGMQADVAGPIGIAQVTGEAVKFGFRAVLEFMSILSLNLAVLNILPFPALDGGRLLFVVLEKFIGKRIKPAFERTVHQVGMMVLFALILLVSVNDILRLLRGG